MTKTITRVYDDYESADETVRELLGAAWAPAISASLPAMPTAGTAPAPAPSAPSMTRIATARMTAPKAPPPAAAWARFWVAPRARRRVWA